MVKELSGSVFSSRNISNIIMPDSIVSIGSYAFYNNKLTALSLTESLESIGNHALYNNKITTLNLADALAAGSYAAKEGHPILLTDGNRLTKTTMDYITER